MNIILGNLSDDRIEMAERKGIGHPDTICDEVTEQISIALSKYYLNEFGAIMHHNVDKALLIGGRSEPKFKGGKIIEPISLIIAGRATHEVKGKIIPVEEIAVEAIRKWFLDNIRYVNAIKDLKIAIKIRPGSADLVELFSRFGKGEVPLANDTSLGAGYYPNTFLENTIIKIEQLLNHPKTKAKFPFIGEDIKVMGVKDQSKSYFTISIAMIDQYILNLKDYISKIKKIEAYIFSKLPLVNTEIYINTADDYERESLYLTVTGTSAESGDDGQVGRGNRINGLITPYFPMTLEATSGKNPVSHVGKIYNHFAMDLSRSIVENHFAKKAQVFIVSQIGKPIDQPQILHLKLNDIQVDEGIIKTYATEKMNELPYFWKKMVV